MSKKAITTDNTQLIQNEAFTPSLDKGRKNRGKTQKVEIDWEQFDDLCRLQCTLREIAYWFDCSEDTIENACKVEKNSLFSELFQQKRLDGFISLRRKQFQQATMGNGNTAMLIFLGKNWLGQSDRQDIQVEDKREINIDIPWKGALAVKVADKDETIQ